MINVRKGNAHSLAQTDFLGVVNAHSDSGPVTAGMIVAKHPTTGELRPVMWPHETDHLVGFAITNQNEGDAIESGKLGAYALDGSSVIETDQFSGGPYTAADVGKIVVWDGVTPGVVAVVSQNDVNGRRVYGYVYDAPRSIFVGFTPTTVLPIQLAPMTVVGN